MDLSRDIKYFNNTKSYERKTEYDLFFSYTKMFPLWDERKSRENRRYPPDIHENIFQQVLLNILVFPINFPLFDRTRTNLCPP